ncbi:MAG: GNAT family N-acetyltransferase [Pseudomonadales bacterium]
MNELDLMHSHCDALYVHNGRSELVRVNDWLRRPAPLLWIGFAANGTLWRFHEDVSARTRARIDDLIDQEPKGGTSEVPLHDDSYRACLGANAAIAGPTYWLASPSSGPGHRVVRVSAANAAILAQGGLEAWIPDIPHQQPMFASLARGRAVAVCASVRSTPVAHEAGVETLPDYRRQGHAAAAVAAWAQELRRGGIMPLYSTSWNNLASQAVARRVGFQAFGWEYRVG